MHPGLYEELFSRRARERLHVYRTYRAPETAARMVLFTVQSAFVTI